MKMSKVADASSLVLMVLKCSLEQWCLFKDYYSVILNAFPSGILCKRMLYKVLPILKMPKVKGGKGSVPGVQ